MYIDTPKNANIDDVISANMSLMESLFALGIPIQQYAKHFRFLADKAKVYTSVSLVKYDRAVREKAELLGPSSFGYGDLELVHSFLGVENVKPKAKATSQGAVPSGSNFQGGKKPKRYCWRFNDQRGCKKDDCGYKHECKSCGGPHSVVSCADKR